jgi:hypothetical protein
MDVLPYLQAVALALGAIYNGMLAFEAYPTIWKVALSTLTALFLAVMAWHKLWPLF